MSGRFTMPWMSSRCLSGSMSGTPLWCRSKCSPLGVIMPSSDSSGVREAPLPVVPGCERMSVRVTLLSCLAGLPYSLIPAPGTFIDGGTSGGSTASACLAPPATRPLAASNPTPGLMKLRLDSSIVPLPATPCVQRPSDRDRTKPEDDDSQDDDGEAPEHRIAVRADEDLGAAEQQRREREVRQRHAGHQHQHEGVDEPRHP